MNMFPINLDIRGRKVVIVGGGGVAERKCRALLEAEAAVMLVAPDTTAGLTDLEREGDITILRRSYRPSDLSGAVLAFAATDDRSVNLNVVLEAKRHGIPICVADAPEDGTFISPSTVRRGDLLISISTGGRSPALARRLRQDLEERYGPEYAELTTILGALREKLLTAGLGGAYNNQLFKELLAGDLSRLLDPDQRERIIREITHPDTGLTPHPADTEEPS